MAIARFPKGSSTYTCRFCKKLTRQTGNGGIDGHTCDYCNEEGGWENMLDNGECTEEEFNTGIAALKVQYGRA